MFMFSLGKGGKLKRIKEVPVKFEREIQKITEDNLEEIFGLELVKSEFVVKNLRIDTLAFAPVTNSFVIIEYKKKRTFSVIDQGFAYLSTLLNSKAEFLLAYNQIKNKNLRKKDVDWSQSRVIFIAPEFTEYQIQAVNFRDLPFELWEFRKYENGVVIYHKLEPIQAEASLKEIAINSPAVRKVSEETTKYTEETHLKKVSEEMREIYMELRERILNLGSEIEVRPTRNYIGFSPGKWILFAWFYFLKRSDAIKLILWISKDEIEDPKGITEPYSDWGVKIMVNKHTDLDYLMPLIKQAYQKHR